MKCGRCDFRADDLTEHAAEVGHYLCIVCQRQSLTEHERQTCADCVSSTRDDLTAVAEAYDDIERVLIQAAYRGVALPDLLAVLGDGRTQGGGADDDLRYRDPCSAAAQLETAERDWREEFGHGSPPYPPLGAPRRPLYVFVQSYRYLKTWHTLAANTHPDFDSYAVELRDLRSRLEHLAGLASDPRRDPVPCACGGRLIQEYGDKGLAEDRRCRSCGAVYPPTDYAFHLRLLTDTPGWTSISQAARMLDRPVVTIKAWVASLELPAVCNRLTRRLLVDIERAQELDEERPTRRRAG